MDENGFDQTDEPFDPESYEASAREERHRFPWGAFALAVWILALVIFSVQNAEHATVNFLGWSFDISVALLVIVTALVTLLLTGVGFAFYRRKKRKAAIQAGKAESDA